MKNTFFLLVAIITTSLFFLSGCAFDDCKETVKYQVYNPVYLTKAQLRNIEIREPEKLKNPGKIYVYGKYLFVNELYEGVHVFDNSNPSNPVNLSFISIPGNVDIAVKENILYADNFIDLLSFDITDPTNPKSIKKIENVFSKNKYENPGSGYLVYYKPTDRIEEIDCDDITGDIMFNERGDVLAGPNATGGFDGSKGSGSATGLGGSMARFTILKDRLYIVDNTSLQVVNVEKAEDPYLTNKVDIGWGIETIYPFKDNLFIGSNTGMFIYSAVNPDKPELLSNFVHAVACDPVYVVGDIAYVTLRTGTRCWGIKDQLDVIDIKNILSPKLLKTYEMSNPHGLSVIDNKMVLCEGEFGLKVLDVEKPLDIETKSKIQNKHFYDVIILSENDIIVVGNDGLYQYKTDGFDLKELSVIKVED